MQFIEKVHSIDLLENRLSNYVREKTFRVALSFVQFRMIFRGVEYTTSLTVRKTGREEVVLLHHAVCIRSKMQENFRILIQGIPELGTVTNENNKICSAGTISSLTPGNSSKSWPLSFWFRLSKIRARPPNKKRTTTSKYWNLIRKKITNDQFFLNLHFLVDIYSGKNVIIRNGMMFLRYPARLII